MRLNRPQLVEYRLRNLLVGEIEQSLHQRIQMTGSTQDISEAIADLRDEERELLKRKRKALSGDEDVS